MVRDGRHGLKAITERPAALPPGVGDDMYRLFSRYYEGISRERFAADLSAKDTVILVFDEDRICGFSTIAVLSLEHRGAPVRVVFSGDTIMDRPYWGTQVFAFAWIRQIGRIAAEAQEVPLYWLLTVKGHRTYRYLPAFGLRFVPDWRGAPDPVLEDLKDEVAARYFGAAYRRDSGIVRHECSLGHLAPEWAAVSAREARRPDVRYFLERNPGYAEGDELVCLCELTPGNMRPLTRRLFQQGLKSS